MPTSSLGTGGHRRTSRRAGPRASPDTYGSHPSPPLKARTLASVLRPQRPLAVRSRSATRPPACTGSSASWTLPGRKQSIAEFWIQMQGRFIHIRYFPLWDERGTYRGTLEVVQDVTDIRALEGERRLLDVVQDSSCATG